jgi:hypothetical protein
MLRTRVGGSLKIFQNPTLKQEEKNKIVTLVSYKLRNTNIVMYFSEKLTCYFVFSRINYSTRH